MAFVSGVVPSSVRAQSKRQAVCMSVSRRDFLVSIAAGSVLAVTPVLAADKKIDLSLKELAKEAESLKYEDEVLLNPDPAEGEKSRFQPKKTDKVGSYREADKKLEEMEEARYSAAVAAELKAGEELKKKFSK